MKYPDIQRNKGIDGGRAMGEDGGRLVADETRFSVYGVIADPSGTVLTI